LLPGEKEAELDYKRGRKRICSGGGEEKLTGNGVVTPHYYAIIGKYKPG